MSESSSKYISGNRIFVTYRIAGEEKDALASARDICFEQTVEFPDKLIPSDFIRNNVVGKLEQFTPYDSGGFKAVISYAQETAAKELTQLLNLVFGNISIKTGIRVCDIVFPKAFLSVFSGPRFGRKGLRELLNVFDRPLLCTALKPMGLSASRLAELAYLCAVGGIDIIKDDHGLTNQCFASFHERVKLCAEAVIKANKKTNRKCIYVANVTSPFDEIHKCVEFAKQCGADAVMLAPGITGFDTMRAIAGDDSLGLLVFSHPAFLGTYLINPSAGISHYVLLGLLNRLAGADAVVYPNYGGRFPFTRRDCEEIIAGVSVDMEHIPPIFPVPGGGISLDKIPELIKFYGREVIFLIGAGLFTRGDDFIENCRYFRELIKDGGTNGLGNEKQVKSVDA